MAVIAKILLVLTGIWLTTASWLVIVQPDFHYSVNLPFKETVALFKSIKQTDQALKPPPFTYNGKIIHPKDTTGTNWRYYVDYYSPEEKAIYGILIYQNGLHTQSLPETFITFRSIIYLENEGVSFKPRVREPLKIKENKIILKRFNELIMNKVNTKLDSLGKVKNTKLKINRTLL